MRLPFWTSVTWLFSLFFLCLIVSHLLFVWPQNRSKRWWKYIDYAWLGFAFFGAISTAGLGRQAIAANLLPMAGARLERLGSDIESALRFGASSAVCRHFVRAESPLTPEKLDRIQREFDALCAWSTQALPKLKTSPLAKRELLRFEDLGGPLPTGADDLPARHIRDTVDRYNAALPEFQRLSRDADRSELQWFLITLGPSLFVVALAVRIAKVTGELRHDMANVAPRSTPR